MLSEMRQSLQQGSEHTTDSCITVDAEKKPEGSAEELAATTERRNGLGRTRSMIIAVKSPTGNKNRRGNLTFSNSVRQLSRAGTSRRHLTGGESIDDSAVLEESSYPGRRPPLRRNATMRT
jgi:hypothetical protein